MVPTHQWRLSISDRRRAAQLLAPQVVSWLSSPYMAAWRQHTFAKLHGHVFPSDVVKEVWKKLCFALAPTQVMGVLVGVRNAVLWLG